MIKFVSLNLAIQILSSGKFPQWSLYLTPQKRPDHHLTPSLNRPHVLVVLSSGLIPMDITFSSNSILMVMDPLRAIVLQYYSPSSLATMTIFWNGPSQRSSKLEFKINWTQWTTGCRQSDPAYRKPTMSSKSGAATVLINNFIPHSKLFSDTEGFPIDGASFIEIKHSDPSVLKPQTQTSLLFPFPKRPPIIFTSFWAGWVIALHITLKR